MTAGVRSAAHEAVVAIGRDGTVRAVFAIDSKADERDALCIVGDWLRNGRTVKRCSEAHAFSLVGKPWVEPPANAACDA